MIFKFNLISPFGYCVLLLAAAIELSLTKFTHVHQDFVFLVPRAVERNHPLVGLDQVGEVQGFLAGRQQLVCWDSFSGRDILKRRLGQGRLDIWSRGWHSSAFNLIRFPNSEIKII